MRCRAGLRIGVACLALVLIGAGLVRAVPGARRVVRAATDAFTLDWWTVDAGGGTSDGPTYSLSGTLGQFDADPSSAGMSGPGFRVTGGFWAGVSEEPPDPEPLRVYVPLLMRE